MKAASVEVQLLGQKIAVKATASDPVRMRAVADLVSARLKSAEGRVKGLVPHHVALLALFELAEEYLAAKDRATESSERLERKVDELLSAIESEQK